jgi:uncharacterized protein YdeI (YjbR/CyaY-like superfamily)
VSSGLKEELKWSVPCYTYNRKNIVALAAFKDCVEISFFKGALLHDPQNYLIARGENSQHGKGLRFTDSRKIILFKKIILDFIKEAIENEVNGLKIQTKSIPEPMPLELQEYLSQHKTLSEAYYALTPGKQRSYIIYISGAKQSETRIKRIAQCIDKILRGEGFHDTYKKAGK